MEINVRYGFDKDILDRKASPYYVSFAVSSKDNGFLYPFIDVDTEWISIDDLVSEEYLNANKIEYYKDIKTNEIIPIGIVNFNNKSGKNSFGISVDGEFSTYKVSKIIENIYRAIQEKYKADKFIFKCKQRFTDAIKLED